MIKSNEIYTLLQSKGVTHLHHSNTVLTALTFINNRALLSRQYVEKNSLSQTSQLSDDIDKVHEVWDDVFLDGLDLHKYYGWRNIYGPVLFKIKLEILLSPSFPMVHVTTNNPQYWKPNDIKYYDQASKVAGDYLKGNRTQNARIMFTLKAPETKIQLSKYCDGIIVDNPDIILPNTEERVVDRAAAKIITALKINRLGQIPVTLRHDNENRLCKCLLQYNMIDKFNKSKLRSLFGAPAPLAT